jgi:hypothetical protein
MKQVIADSLGFDVPVQVPSSVEEYDQLAGRSGACLDDAINNVIYRGVLAVFRRNLASALEKETSFPIERKQKVNAKKEPQFDAQNQPILVLAETEGDYVGRLQAHLGLDDDAFKSRFANTAATVATGLKFDPKASERAPRTPPKTYLEAARSVIAGGGTYENAAKKLSAQIGRDVPATEEGVAFAIQEREANRRKEVVADLIS